MSSVSPISLGAGVRPEHISEEEWELRVQLAGTYRIFQHLGWHMVIFNHITARVPGPEHHFLINPFGLRYDEVTASNLVKIDLDGNVIDGDSDINYAGFVIHSAIHGNVDDARWIMHTHTKEGAAVSCKKGGLENTNFYSAMIWDHVAYHDFEGMTVHDDERERIVKSIGSHPCVMLRNHGLLSHGRTVQEAFGRLWIMQLACETQLLTISMAGENLEISREATERSMHDSRLFNTNNGECSMELYAALQRIVDEQDSSYRH
jgi:ribulose-5-phosphate 4-epimerase/fuculose-1-phosphate aldolase